MSDKIRVVRAATEAGWHLVLTAPGLKRTHWRTVSVHDATRDAGLLEGWIIETPDVGLAVNLGRSGLCSIEHDGEAALGALRELEAEHGALPPTLGIQARRGWHRLFRVAAQPRGRYLADDLQFLCHAQYVVIPPTEANGVRRRWIIPRSGVKVAQLPAWVLEHRRHRDDLHEDQRVVLDGHGELELRTSLSRLRMRPSTPGTRRGTAVFAAACHLGRYVAAGELEVDQVFGELYSAARHLGLSEYEARRSVERGLELGPQRSAA
jgi:hypothetical protein